MIQPFILNHTPSVYHNPSENKFVHSSSYIYKFPSCPSIPSDLLMRTRSPRAPQQSALGEYFGHHEDAAVACMHAWVDLGPSLSGVTIDAALRAMLDQFRLPGEAQK